MSGKFVQNPVPDFDLACWLIIGLAVAYLCGHIIAAVLR